MRLSHLKLSGFKSFVDPTTVHFPSALTGIVGPNGCGKSNVIDAVRWVMGEASAKHLRGDSMADVIFNGSNARKPVAQASVEMVFDNSDGGLGGQYAEYGEIAIRRQVARSGQSNYYLNGTKCRRRDITDIFLGTGLGPRSYSIIEQGMISRLIEAKPEDLRSFLEEAAGISKYKERRRETETRIKHTKENLSRLNDLREEIEKQLEKLKRQARSAVRFKELRDEEKRVKAELLTLRYQSLYDESREQREQLKQEEVKLEAIVAELRAVEADLTKGREDHITQTEAFNEVQGQFYEIGTEVARIEQIIQHAKETRQSQSQELAKTEQAWTEAQAHIKVDGERLELISSELTENEPTLEKAEADAQASRSSLDKAETDMQEWQTQWEAFNLKNSESSQTAQVERTRIDHLERGLAGLQSRLDRITQELKVNNTATLEADIGSLAKLVEERDTTATTEQKAVDEVRENIERCRDQLRQNQTELHTSRSLQQDMRGRISSLQALQQAALGEQENHMVDWLSRHGLADAPRLAKQIDVEKGWETAVETVLGNSLEAVCSDGAASVTQALASIQEGSITLVDTRVTAADIPSDHQADLLVNKIKSPWPISGLLAGIFIADSLESAMALQRQLAANESVVTADGIWLGQGWTRVARSKDGKSGVLAREQQLLSLEAEMAANISAVALLDGSLEKTRDELKQAESQQEERQLAANQAHRALSEAKAQLESKRNRLEQAHKRIGILQKESEEITTQVQQDQQSMEAARKVLHQALAVLEEMDTDRQSLDTERTRLREALDTIRSSAQVDRDTAHELALKVRSFRTEQETTTQNLERMRSQQAHLDARRSELKTALEESETPVQTQSDELSVLVKKRHEVEALMKEERIKVETLEQALRKQEEQRQEKEQLTQKLREALSQGQIHWQEIKVRSETLLEQVSESGFELATLIEEIAEDATTDVWGQKAEQLEKSINRLGPINLAAIEEFETESERKEYLDAQYTDVTDALETLEDAIRKIDTETRTRFKETYDKVNEGFQEGFPRLFGGGHAYLELTGDDLLDTGVTVMARPPGKRNSTIHLLSGGEKALTAVALVFAIFRLNPSPFCMLDEVDAPLDDANVGRFCKMVEEMSETVQFIFITHNKITMDLSNQLTGVTMHEPGVSRLVTVDVEEAVQLAAV
ncbi:MAG: chromosome segregation protein SMC [Gammaproteobacteria bacterium]